MAVVSVAGVTRLGEARGFFRPWSIVCGSREIVLSRCRHRLRKGAPALDALAYGVALIDASARLVWVNGAADRILSANDGLIVAQSVLRGASPDATRVLASFLLETIARCGRTSALRLDRPSLQEPYVVFAAPLAPARLWPAAAEAAAIVIATDPTSATTDTATLLAMIYGLTPAKARRLGVSVNTGHTHLQRTFRKTGVRRQAELAGIVSSLPALSVSGN
jgi:hypothetical protein